MKRRTLIAFFLTLLLYFGLAFLLWPLKKDLPSTKRTVTTLDLQSIRIKHPKPAVTPAQKPITAQKPKTQPIPKPKSQPKLLPKLAPKPTQKPKKKIKKYAKKIPKLSKQIRREVNATKIVKKTKHRIKRVPKRSSNPKLPSLANLFMAQKPKKSELKGLPKEYRKLYKDEFDSFTKEQKEFLKNNLARIGTITQKYLYLRGYPYIAVKTRQQGTNIVEFYLHPNGDITGLKLIGSSGYEALDSNTIETIKTAYKDYPLPKEKTKIRIYVKYSLIY